jgi:hypothetical protein
MKWGLLLVLVSIGLVAGDGAWKENRVYQYRLQAYARNSQEGVVSRARLSIYPQSDDLLIGQISEAKYSKIDQQFPIENFDLNDRDLTYNEWPLNKQFKIHLENGLIRSLSVDPSMTNDQINQLKAIVSQFQVDTKAQNLVPSGDNNLPDRNSNNAFYKTMEPTVTGKCETIYDISAIPEYLVQAQQKWVPLPKLKKDGELIKIVKTRNFNNCNERNGFLFTNGQNDFKSTGNERIFERRNGQNNFISRGNYMNFEHRTVQNDFKSGSNEMNFDQRTNQMDTVTSSPLVTRVFISGDLRTYTIQSSVTSSNVGGFYEYLAITLESVEESNNRRQFRLGNLNNVGNMVNVGNLVYTSDVENSGRSMTYLQNNDRQYSLRSGARCTKAEKATEQWSSCWTAFPSADTICKNSFTAEWEDTRSECCGFLCLGKRAMCRRSYPGCVSTVCYSAFVSHDTLCKDQFSSDMVTCGGFVDCSPGFWAARCCPKSYE